MELSIDACCYPPTNGLSICLLQSVTSLNVRRCFSVPWSSLLVHQFQHLRRMSPNFQCFRYVKLDTKFESSASYRMTSSLGNTIINTNEAYTRCGRSLQRRTRHVEVDYEVNRNRCVSSLTTHQKLRGAYLHREILDPPNLSSTSLTNIT